jgi:ankyrin repeat protein
LDNAIKNNQIDFVKILLNAGADPNYYLEGTNPPIFSVDNDLEIMNLLLKYGADRKKKILYQGDMRSIFSLYVENNNLDMAKPVFVKEFLKEPVVDRFLPLAWVAQNQSDDCFELAKFFLENDADVDEKDAFGNTALMYAMTNPRTLKLLIDYGADVNALDNKDMNALIFLFYDHSVYDLHDYSEKDEDIPKILQNIDALIESGINVNQKDKKGRTALFYIVKYHYSGSARYFKKLLDAGADWKIADNFNNNIESIIKSWDIDSKEPEMQKEMRAIAELFDTPKGFDPAGNRTKSALRKTPTTNYDFSLQELVSHMML